MTTDEIQQILALNAEKRAEYHYRTIQQNQMVWTLVDDDGAVLLVEDELDYVPVWPAKEFVEEWINGEWSHCRAHQISLQDWEQKWIPGLAEDELDIIVFPLPHDGGITEVPAA